MLSMHVTENQVLYTSHIVHISSLIPKVTLKLYPMNVVNACVTENQALYTSHIIQVGTNGIFSFSEPFYSPAPRRFPSTSSSVTRAYLVAPYWDDIDIRLAGNISYEVHSRNGDDLGSNQLLNTISNFVEESTGQSFNATWLLVAEWKEVHPWPHGLGDQFLLLFFPNSNMVSL